MSAERVIVFVPIVTLVVVVAQLPPRVRDPPSVVVKVRSGVVSAVGPMLDGDERVGAVVSTVMVRMSDAIDWLPARSVTLTEKVWFPFESAVVVIELVV